MAAAILWETSMEKALVRAKVEGKPVLLDFFNPGWIGCQQMDAVTYPDEKVSDFIQTKVIPLRVSFDAQPLATDFKVKWTPTLVTLDSDGSEHHRTVGFLGPEELIPSILLGVGKSCFDTGKFDEAVASLDTILQGYARSASAPEAVFLKGVSLYKGTHNPRPLRDAYDRLQAEYPDNEWTKRAYPYRLINWPGTGEGPLCAPSPLDAAAQVGMHIAGFPSENEDGSQARPAMTIPGSEPGRYWTVTKLLLDSFLT
jgi:hypothetical protein